MILNKLNTIRIFLLLLFVSFSSGLYAQLSVDGTPTPAQLVQNVLLGSGVTVSNITYTGNVNCRGSFNGTASNIGFASGLLLTTGNLTNAIGPNNTTGASVGNGLPGDPDLDIIMSPTVSEDATILEFDFVPLSDTVKFRYVFASEEYMEYVSPFPGGINDAFGFLISGPGISGPYSNNAENIAIIPGTTLPVTMFNLNLNSNSAYYFDNGDGSGTGTAPDGATVQYDGFTVALTAISPVQCGQTYHIKIVIGDGGDTALDSGVFLEAESFSSPGVSIIPQISYGGQNDSMLYEGCGNACILFVRGGTLAGSDTVNLVISGDAVNGTDYYDNSVGPGTLIPSQVIFLPGEDTVSFCINSVPDMTPEGLESIILTIPAHSVGTCVQPAVSTTIYLNEYSPVVVTAGNDTTLCNIASPIAIAAIVTGGVQPYTYSWTNGAPPVPNPTVNPLVNTTYVVTVTDACTGTPDPTPATTDSIRVSLLSIPLITSSVSYGGTNDSTFYEGCGQACIYFVRTLGVNQAATYPLTIGGTAQNGVDFSPALPPSLVFAVGQDSLVYCVQASADGSGETPESILLSTDTVFGACSLNASTNLNIVEPAPLSVTVGGDTTLNCATGPVTIFANASGGLQPYSYSWSNASDTTSSQTVTPSSTTTYTVTVSDECTGSPDPTPDASGAVLVTVSIPTPITVTASDDLTACPDDLVALTSSAAGGNLPYVYLWTHSGVDSATTPNAANTNVVATSTTLFTVTVTDDCGNSQSDDVAVNVEQSCLLNIPNIITPDNVGPALNELFYIENLDRFPPSSLLIYNRFGNKIYESSNYQNNWNGSKYSDGTYYFVLTVPPAGSIEAKVQSLKPTESYSETLIGSGKVFSGFFQIVRAK